MSVSQSTLGASGEIPLDQVLFCGLVHQVLLVLLRARQALDAQFTHDGEDQLLVDHHVLFADQGGPDPQHPIGAPRALVDVGNEPRDQEAADLAIRWHVVLELVEDRA
jgi:hypothetical protein